MVVVAKVEDAVERFDKVLGLAVHRLDSDGPAIIGNSEYDESSLKYFAIVAQPALSMLPTRPPPLR